MTIYKKEEFKIWLTKVKGYAEKAASNYCVYLNYIPRNTSEPITKSLLESSIVDREEMLKTLLKAEAGRARNVLNLYVEFLIWDNKEGANIDNLRDHVPSNAISLVPNATNKNSSIKSELLSGKEILDDACQELSINLTHLVAKVAVWANPQVVDTLRKENDNDNALWIKNCRRKKGAEKRGMCNTTKCYLDDNTRANNVIKVATGRIAQQGGFAGCHIYDESCYDIDYHTSIPNLVLIPIAIYSLADHDEKVKSALRYHAYKLYNFFKDTLPEEPEGYSDIEWRDYAPFTAKIEKSIRIRTRREF